MKNFILLSSLIMATGCGVSINVKTPETLKLVTHGKDLKKIKKETRKKLQGGWEKFIELIKKERAKQNWKKVQNSFGDLTTKSEDRQNHKFLLDLHRNCDFGWVTF